MTSELAQAALLLKGPIALSHDNFTPATRTPWAGHVIYEKFKKHLFPGGEAALAIGESWEFSCDESFPSKVFETDVSLQQLVEAYPKEVLSARLAGAKTCDILVKYVNAADPLSIQVHPADGDSDLKAHECGKPESWFVLDAQAGGGIYLGFSKAMSREELAIALQTGTVESVRSLLQFVPVRAGDYFEVAPGVPHVIGAGVTILEPQRITRGKQGKTFRLWDWGRTYDDQGRLDPVAGKPRELHLAAGLKLIDPMHQVGGGFVASCRRQPKVLNPVKGVTIAEYPEGAHYQFRIVGMQAGANAMFEVENGYGAQVIMRGEIRCKGRDGLVEDLLGGQSALWPHAAMPLRLTAKTTVEFALVLPAGSPLIVSEI